jgi:hypothetical protein
VVGVQCFLLVMKKIQEQLKLAQDGNAESQYFVGLAYERANGVDRSDLEILTLQTLHLEITLSILISTIH